MDLMILGSNRSSDDWFFSSNRRIWLWCSPSLLFNGYRSSFRGVKRPKLEGSHVHLVPRLKMSGVITDYLIRLHDVSRDKFTIYLVTTRKTDARNRLLLSAIHVLFSASSRLCCIWRIVLWIQPSLHYHCSQPVYEWTCTVFYSCIKFPKQTGLERERDIDNRERCMAVLVVQHEGERHKRSLILRFVRQALIVVTDHVFCDLSHLTTEIVTSAVQ